MKADYVANTELNALLDPDHRAWQSHASEPVTMMGTPAGMQPTAAIQVSWMGKKIGAVDRVLVRALHTGDELAFRLVWADESENAELTDNDSFPDAAAILLPVVPEAPIITMGAPGQPVNAWYWRADAPRKARQVTAEGLGTSHTFDQTLVHGRGSWKEGRWHVVLARSLKIKSDTPVAQLEPGSEIGFGVAIWEGSNSERAGIKSFSGNWMPLQLAPANAGRNA
jgi:DMSO reductase family type II enzyme heme b subunit